MTTTETTWLQHSGRYIIEVPTIYEVEGGRINFWKSDFSFKDDIKSMKGAKWHPDDKYWSATDCLRNWIQMEFLEGKNPLAWFDRPLQSHALQRSELARHQQLMANALLTYHYQILACDAGVGKTLAMIEVMEQSGLSNWVWACPAQNIDAIDVEFFRWGLKVPCEIVSHGDLKRRVEAGDIPQGLVIDESHKFKTAETIRTQGGQRMADAIREKHGYDGYVALLSGTVAPNQPIDIWAQAEVAWPGFLKEGSPKALLRRLADLAEANPDHGFREDILGWKEDEVELLSKRLQGLMTVVRMEDTEWELPPLTYRKVKILPADDVLRVAKAIANTEASAASAAIKLRELSDGFNYVEEEDGTVDCPACGGGGRLTEWVDPASPDRKYKAVEMLQPDVVEKLEEVEVECFNCSGTRKVPNYKKVSYEIPCEKEDALRKELAGEDRILIFAGFKGSIDRCVRVCQEEGWDVIRCDGRGFKVLGHPKEKPLRYWIDRANERVAYVAHPESGATSFTLTESRKVVFYSNTHRHDHREQAIARAYRYSQTRPVEVVDICNLPSDYRVIEIVDGKKKLESMALGDFLEGVFNESAEATS